MFYIATFDKVGFLNNMLRPLAGGIDALIYQLISWIFEGIFNLNNIIVNKDFANTLYNRVYVILAIYMVFKLSVSFIQYLISPDAMVDKEKGVAKLIGNTMIMLVLIILLPILFFNNEFFEDGKTILVKAQDGVLNTLPKIILGNTTSGDVASNAAQNGDQIALTMLTAFYYDHTCDDSTCDDISKTHIASFNDFENSLVNEDGDVYQYKYKWPLTTIAGIILVIILIGIAIDVAIRIFKIVVLEVMAPVPVMSYIDPKSSKDGAFSSWLHTFISTYIDIFIKLGSVYLILLLISQVFSSNGLFDMTKVSTGFTQKTFVYVFLTLGLFKFAKDAPKFIKDALGIKDKGDGGGFMGKAVAGLAGAAAGFAGGLAAGGGLSGALSGASGGFSAGSQNAGSGKPLNAYSQIRDQQAKALGKTPGGLKGKMQANANKRALAKMGLSEGTLDAAKNEMLTDKARLAAGESALQQAIDNRADDGSTWWLDANGNIQRSTNADAAIQTLARAKSAAESKSVSSEKRFNEMDKAYEAAGGKKGFYDKHHRGVVDSARGKVGAVYYALRHPIQNVENIAYDAKEGIKDRAQDVFNVRNSNDKRYDDRANDRRANHYSEQDGTGNSRNRDQV